MQSHASILALAAKALLVLVLMAQLRDEPLLMLAGLSPLSLLAAEAARHLLQRRR